jgi:hypothetical protein
MLTGVNHLFEFVVEKPVDNTYEFVRRLQHLGSLICMRFLRQPWLRCEYQRSRCKNTSSFPGGDITREDGPDDL